ncbi:hypothetical protein BSLG_008180 [Batrachochytrium salamandrivorans]|nr:hypothetical protein BSLG_008180 [Batrachochytrium salamandrivorans]
MSTREAGAADIGIDAASQSSKWPKQRSSYAGDMSFPTEKRQPLLLHQPQPTIQRTDPAACSYPSFTFAKDSIFYKEPLNVEPNSTAYSSCGSWPLKHSVPSHAIPPISISKPAVKMNATELAALRAGRDIQQAPSPSSACSTLPCSDDGGARITEPQKCSNANSSQSCVMGNEVDTAYLRSMNRDTRRGFIDLDEVMIPTSLSSSKAAGSKSLPKTKLDLLATPSITHPAVWNQINLSFLPTAKNFLGEGRYAEVYRGSYTLSGDAGLSIGSPRSAQSSQALSSVTCAALGGRRRSSTLVSGQSPADTPFFDCAVKRLHATTEAQSIGLAESFILRRVAGLHRNIVSLIGVKDEADLHALTVKNKLVQLLDTFPSMQVEPTQHSAKSTANQSVQSYSKPPSTASGKKKSPTAATAPNPAPQLLLVLEYLPNGNLWDWAMRHKESVGRILWMKWARELAGAIEAIHSIGIVHHDIKPHNILLSDLLDIRLADFGNACFVPEMGPDQILERLSPTAASPASFNHTGAGDSS